MQHRGARAWRLAVAVPAVALGGLAPSRPADAAALAILHTKQATVAAGSTVTVVGRNYRSGLDYSNVQIRLNTRDGPVIASITPRPVLVDVPVTIPAGTPPGEHTLVATQHRLSDGLLFSGGPGRASVIVTAPRSAGGAPSGVAAVAGGSWTRDAPSSWLTVGLGPAVLGLALATIAARRRRLPGAGVRAVAVAEGPLQDGVRRKIRSPLPLAVAT